MAKIISTPILESRATFELNDAEMPALWALACYGTDEFLKVFYTQMGVSYLKPHEEGLRSLFASVASECGRIFKQTEEARKVFRDFGKDEDDGGKQD